MGQTRVRIGTGGVTDKPLPRIPFCLLFKSNKQTSTPLEILKSVQFGRKRVEFDILKVPQIAKLGWEGN